MLNARELDDQTYEQIVDNARGRLPWICPEWTNHNSSDPGITILELMAWYKELQQYHLNKLTDELRLKLLKLAGAVPRGARPATCQVHLGPEIKALPALTRLRTDEGVPFELVEPLPEDRPRIERVVMTGAAGRAGTGDKAGVMGAERSVDVMPLVRDRRMTFAPFRGARDRSGLRIGFSRTGGDTLRLWISVASSAGADRNPFAADSPDTRTVKWTCEGADSTELIRDDTRALCVSGYVTLRHTGSWPAGREGLHWLTLELDYAGCEDEIRVDAIFEDTYVAVQQETWARTHLYRATPSEKTVVRLRDAQALRGTQRAYILRHNMWERTEILDVARREDGLELCLRTAEADPAEETAGRRGNVMVVSLDADRWPELTFDARGLPGETFLLGLEGRTAIREGFTLLCNTRHRDGTVSPELWRRVDDLYNSGPEDRVFTYDPARGTVTFGDGEHGALLAGGEGAVMVSDLTVTYCAVGAIPRDAALWLDGGPEDAPRAVEHTDARDGAADETVDQVRARLLHKLDTTRKCVTAGDYERIAGLTPGLRIGRVKAIPGYDPEEPTAISRCPAVTVMVAPAGDRDKLMPDDRFLDAVRRELDSVRPIGVRALVAAPEYIDVDVTVSLGEAAEGARERLAELLRKLLGEVEIGGTVRLSEVSDAVRSSADVLRVRSVWLEAAAPGCSRTADGDLRLPKMGIPCLRELKLLSQGPGTYRE